MDNEQQENNEQPAATPDAAASDAQIQDLQTRLNEAEDRWKRSAAELDNYRKRMHREMEHSRLRERETILRSWIDVIDNMERALSAEGAVSNPWYDGVEAIHQQMLGVLKKFGAQPFDARGELFDPRRHEAVATANLPDKPEGTIVEVIQTGYVLDGKILRHAKVVPVKRS